MKLVVGEIETRTDRKQRVWAEAHVSIGPLPIIYSTLRAPKNPDNDDKYTVMFKLTPDQRKEVIDTLAPAAVDIALKQGYEMDLKKAKSIIRNKLKETLDEDGSYRLVADARVLRGSTKFEPTIIGPDGDKLPSVMLADGSEGAANFLLRTNKYDGNVTFPFQLDAIKITNLVPYESEDGDTYEPGVARSKSDDFAAIDSSY